MSEEPKRIDEMGKALADMKLKMADYLVYQDLVAQLTRRRFEALMKNGFTKEQALELTKKIF